LKSQRGCLIDMIKFSYPNEPFLRKGKGVSRFKILGERCSGTYYAQRLIQHNLNIEHCEDYGHKHFWTKRKENYPKDLLLVIMVRDPYTWAESFYRKKWHVPEHFHSLNFSDFITSEFFSIKDQNIPNIAGEVGEEIMADRNLVTMKRHKNLFALRSYKLNFIFHEFPKMCQNMVVLRLEDLQEDFEANLRLLSKKFRIQPRNERFEDLLHYKGNTTLPLYEERDLSLSDDEIRLVNQNLDWHWETIMNYQRKIVT